MSINKANLYSELRAESMGRLNSRNSILSIVTCVQILNILVELNLLPLVASAFSIEEKNVTARTSFKTLLNESFDRIHLVFYHNGTYLIVKVNLTYGLMGPFEPPSMSHKLMIFPLFFLHEHWSIFWQTSAKLCAKRNQIARKAFTAVEYFLSITTVRSHLPNRWNTTPSVRAWLQ